MSRADARRVLRDAEALIRQGLDSVAGNGDHLLALARVLRDRLRVARARGSVTTLMYFMYENAKAGAKHIADVPVACGKGCSHCCNIWVDASPPEVFYAVGTMNRRQREAALASVLAALEQTEGRTFDDRGEMVTPCPLLAGNLCTVYGARPLNCRTAVSADMGVCERSYIEISGEDIPTPLVWVRLRQGYGVALRAALQNAGLVGTSREWNASLRIALTESDAEARWFAGEDVFAAAPLAPGADDVWPLQQQLAAEAFG